MRRLFSQLRERLCDRPTIFGMITGDQNEQLVMTVDEWGMRRWWHAWCVQATSPERAGPVAEAAENMWTAKWQWLALMAWHVGEGRFSAPEAGHVARIIELWGELRAETGRMAVHPDIPLYMETATEETSPNLRANWKNWLDTHTQHSEQPLSTKPTALTLPPGSG